MRNFGFFVDVPDLTMSGLVHLSSLEDDFYVFDSDRSQLVGRRTRRVVQLGDRLTVQVAKVDTFKKQVDFRLSAAPRLGGEPARKERFSRRDGLASKQVSSSKGPPKNEKRDGKFERPPNRSGSRRRRGRGAPWSPKGQGR